MQPICGSPWISRWRQRTHTHKMIICINPSEMLIMHTSIPSAHTHFVCMKRFFFKDEWIHESLTLAKWMMHCRTQVRKKYSAKNTSNQQQIQNVSSVFSPVIATEAGIHTHTHTWAARARKKYASAQEKFAHLVQIWLRKLLVVLIYSVFFLAMFSPHSCSVCVCARVCLCMRSVWVVLLLSFLFFPFIRSIYGIVHIILVSCECILHAYAYIYARARPRPVCISWFSVRFLSRVLSLEMNSVMCFTTYLILSCAYEK